MEKRILLAIVISLGLLWGWAAIAPKLFPEMFKPRPQSASKAKTTTSGTASTATSTAPATSNAPPTVPSSLAKPSVISAARPEMATAETITTVDRPLYTAKFTNRGAQLISFRLKHYKTRDGSTMVDLVKARERSRADYPFTVRTGDENAVGSRLNSALYMVRETTNGNAHEIEYRYAANGIAMRKVFRLGDDYQFRFETELAPATIPYRIEIGPGIRTLAPDEIDSRVIITGNGIIQREGKIKVTARDSARFFENVGNVEFVGLEDNYFLTVLRPERAGEGILRKKNFHTPGQKLPRADVHAGLNAAHGTIVGNAFFGPKEAKVLDAHGLSAAMQLGWFEFIGRFLLEALIWINQFTKNYGFAIIVLTILIKIILYPLQHKGMMSMKRMQRVQPKMEAIKKKYKNAKTDPDQRQKMNVEMMAMYQKEGINPMSGCWPMLIQMPIFFALYGVLSRAIELREAPFILWIRDLSDKDPYYVLPLLMTAAWLIQTISTPSTADPAQKRIFMIMPLVFGFFFKDMPSGLTLYWLVQNVLTIIQQLIMNTWWKEHPAELQKD